jgi:hypothetical protein
MSSGQSYGVRHPEKAWLTRTDLLVGVGESEEGVPAEFRIGSLLHVTTVVPPDGGQCQSRLKIGLDQGGGSLFIRGGDLPSTTC